MVVAHTELLPGDAIERVEFLDATMRSLYDVIPVPPPTLHNLLASEAPLAKRVASLRHHAAQLQERRDVIAAALHFPIDDKPVERVQPASA